MTSPIEPGRLLWLLLLSLLVSCGGTRWEVAHPRYQLPPPDASIAVVALGEAFMLTRPAWFSAQLGIPADSVHARLASLTDSLLLARTHSRWPKAQTAPSSLRKDWARESQKLDETIYLKTLFPHQGKPLFVNGQSPDFLLLIHEYTLGGDLRREQFYDYRQANQETGSTKDVAQLSVLISFSLWDNRLQIPLYSGLAESQIPLKLGKLNLDTFLHANQQALNHCLRLLDEAHP